MNISSEEFINFYSIAVHPKPSQIAPICISPFTSKDKSIHVQVIPTTKPTSEDDKIIYQSYKIIKDKDCFYQISNQELITLVQKVSNNRCVWNIPAFFPANFVAASLSHELLFIGLSNKTINIIDTNTGVCCFPSVFVEDKILYLISEDNYIICFTSNNNLMIWEIESKCLRSIIHEKYEGPELGDIQKITLTNELLDDSLSPIIFAEKMTVRFSKTRNGWVNANCKIPAIFGKKIGFRTIYDVEKGFFESLINHEFEEFQRCLTILLEKYIKSQHFNRVYMLVSQILTIIGQGKTNYCEMNPKELLEFMLNIIGQTNQDIVETITKSPEYYNAFNPPSQQQHKEIQEEEQPPHSNISPEQQEVIDILAKNKQNQNQNETFNWPPSNTPIQMSANEQEHLNTESSIANDEIFPTTNESEETSNVNNEDNEISQTQQSEIPIPPVLNIPSPVQQEINISSPPFKLSDKATTEATILSSPKAISSPIKQPKKKNMKQGKMDDFFQIPPKKSDEKKQETPKAEEKKTKSSPKRKGSANNQTISQVIIQHEQNESQNETQNSNEQEEKSQALSQRRSPRTPKKINFDQSPDVKKKTTQRNKKGKAKEKENEEEQQQQQIEGEEENQQETQKKTTNKKTPRKTTKRNATKANESLTNENEEQSTTQQIQQQSQEMNPSNETQIQQPNIVQPQLNNQQIQQPNIVSPQLNNQQIQQPNIVSPQLNNQQIQQPNIVQPQLNNQQIQQPNIVQPQLNNQQIQQNPQFQMQQQQQLNAQQYQINIPREILLNPDAQSLPIFKKLPPQIQSYIINFQKQNNITPKKKSRAKNSSQIQVQQNIAAIQQQQQQNQQIFQLYQLQQQQFQQQQLHLQQLQQQQPEEIVSSSSFSSFSSSSQSQNASQQPQEEIIKNNQSEVNEPKPKRKYTPRKKKEQQQQQQQEGDESLNATENSESLTKPKSTRGRKPKSKGTESEATNDDQQSKPAKKTNTRQRKKKNEEDTSQDNQNDNEENQQDEE